MADEPIPQPDADDDDEWQEVTSSYHRGESLRRGAFVRVSKYGAVEATVSATELVEEIATERGLTRSEWVFALRASVKKGQVACIPVPVAEAPRGAVQPRWYQGKSSVRSAWHIGGVFKDYPALQRNGEVKCLVTRGTGPDGGPALIIPVGAGLDTKTVSGDSSDQSSGK